MKSVKFLVAVTISTLAAVSPAQAQTPVYSAGAHAITNGTPGSGATYVDPVAGEPSAYAENDPAGVQWIYNLNQTLFSDAESFAWADLGALASRAHAVAQRVAAKNFPSGVTATTMSRFTDRFVVTSATLPKNTPVTLTFRAAATIDWQGSGLYYGKVGCTVQVGASSGKVQWTAAYDKPAPAFESPLIVVKTAVGATLWISGRLDTQAGASFFVPGPQYDGEMAIDASCDAPLVEIPADVQLVTDSGVDYAALG